MQVSPDPACQNLKRRGEVCPCAQDAGLYIASSILHCVRQHSLQRRYFHDRQRTHAPQFRRRQTPRRFARAASSYRPAARRFGMLRKHPLRAGQNKPRKSGSPCRQATETPKPPTGCWSSASQPSVTDPARAYRRTTCQTTSGSASPQRGRRCNGFIATA